MVTSAPDTSVGVSPVEEIGEGTDHSKSIGQMELPRGVGLLVVRRGDASALAGAMQRLLDEPGLAQELAAGALRKVDRLKASAVVDRIEATYRDLLGDLERLPLADEMRA